jgi:hypothetical protein
MPDALSLRMFSETGATRNALKTRVDALVIKCGAGFFRDMR